MHEADRRRGIEEKLGTLTGFPLGTSRFLGKYGSVPRVSHPKKSRC